MSDFYSELMGQPELTVSTGTAASSGDNTLVAAPGAGKRLVLLFLKVQNESTTATTCTVKHGSTVVDRVKLAENDAYIREYECPRVLPMNTALVLNLSGANSHGYTVETTTI